MPRPPGRFSRNAEPVRAGQKAFNAVEILVFIASTEAGRESEIRRVARTALHRSEFRHLKLESIDQIMCRLHTAPIPLSGGEEFRDDCEAAVRYFNGTEYRICITKTGTGGTNTEREDKEGR